MKKILLLILVAITSFQIQAQKEMNNWTFGTRVGLTWNTPRSVLLNGIEGTSDATLTGLPTTFRPGLNTYEGCFTISDSDGNLLFYSDGEKVWDKTHKIMPNGLGLTGDMSSAQSGIIFPYPGSKTKYVAVTLGVHDKNFPNTAYYSVIDMSLRENLGDVVATEKNIELPNGVGAISESCTATLAADGSYWIIAPGRGNPTQLNAWKFTKAGIAADPVVTIIPFETIVETEGVGAYGYIKVSHDNKYFAWGGPIIEKNITKLDNYKAIIVGNFDDVTGKFSNIRKIPNPGSTYGVEFSPSLKYLFTGGTDVFRAYDLKELVAGTTTSPLREIATTISDPLGVFYTPQMATDNRLYILTDSSISGGGLALIDNPDEDPSIWKIYRIPKNFFPTGAESMNPQLGLPSFMSSWFAGKGKVQRFHCTGNSHNYGITVEMSGTPSLLPVRLEWDFGDGTTKVNQPIVTGTNSYELPHSYLLPGKYVITVTPYRASGTALDPIAIVANTVDCVFQTNRMIRTDLLNSAQQKK
ncbi:PKD domain-containing protein [Dysgonomonas alginatilytica]|uniref:PKD domain-containing protein n=1 Tax=Dysgonomonas alginatilytica TaxID=1605892 RepID=A0A2V3PHV4_9BACT|nr:PKD domain-containing protein [Dysgonomonas alginatilytica]PXV58842.1 PKD domain-containing protein [Dysgonomonas alginatilytica]